MTAAITRNSQLTDVIECALAQPPSVAGRRLRSERDLALLFGASHSAVRRSLDRLVLKGVLVRRHGSGTYVRRVPLPRGTAVTLPFEPQALFASIEKDADGPPLRPTRRQQQLQLGLWIDWEMNVTPPRQALIRSIISRAEDAGHRLTMHSLCDRADKALSVEELSRRIANAPSDGYLVTAWWSDLFSRAVSEHRAPTVYFQDSSLDITREPMVYLDTHEGIARAVRLFAAEGYQRIALMGLDIPDEPVEPYRKVYHRAMEDAGLSYRAAEFSPINVSQVIAAMRRLWNRPDRPEALYVSDDVVFAGVAEALAINGIQPGRDLAVITFSTPNYPLPQGYDWSRLEVDVEAFGEIIVNSLLRLIQTAGVHISSHAIHLGWLPRQTHRRPNP